MTLELIKKLINTRVKRLKEEQKRTTSQSLIIQIECEILYLNMISDCLDEYIEQEEGE